MNRDKPVPMHDLAHSRMFWRRTIGIGFEVLCFASTLVGLLVLITLLLILSVLILVSILILTIVRIRAGFRTKTPRLADAQVRGD